MSASLTCSRSASAMTSASRRCISCANAIMRSAKISVTSGSLDTSHVGSQRWRTSEGAQLVHSVCRQTLQWCAPPSEFKKSEQLRAHLSQVPSLSSSAPSSASPPPACAPLPRVAAASPAAAGRLGPPFDRAAFPLERPLRRAAPPAALEPAAEGPALPPSGAGVWKGWSRMWSSACAMSQSSPTLSATSPDGLRASTPPRMRCEKDIEAEQCAVAPKTSTVCAECRPSQMRAGASMSAGSRRRKADSTSSRIVP
mmetsp:Transcript_38367/g.88703  ORF Transcript_38367/g.88703 Transcript_38367/m.88703 type:complete len:255 (-) Transcript_38367:648-1412(-)